MTNEERAVKLKDVDVLPIIKDFDLFCDLVENKIVNKNTGASIGLETKKQYYIAILPIIGKNGVVQLPEDIVQKYTDKKVEYEKASHEVRTLNIPKRGVAKHPTMTWDAFRDEYNAFLSTHKFTNTVKGRKDLRNAVVVGLYILQRPRRVMDYHNLQYYSKLPNEHQKKDKNIVFIQGDKATLYIDA
jgi:hypothetical protein